MGTVALIIAPEKKEPVLVDCISDESEIAVFQAALEKGETDPLAVVYTKRERQAREEEDFGDYVEELLSRPFVRPEIQHHGLQWLKSKLRIEEFQRSEKEATSIIAQYAFKLYQEQPSRTDFILAGPNAQVRIRIFEVCTRRKAA